MTASSDPLIAMLPLVAFTAPSGMVGGNGTKTYHRAICMESSEYLSSF